jgi:folate-binding protein YgfZ
MLKLSSFLFNQRTKPSFIELNEYLRIEISGEDAESFLSNQLTTNILNQKSDSFKESAIVDEKGKLVSSFFVCKESSNVFFIVVKKELEAELLVRLNKFLISEDVEFETTEPLIFIEINAFENNKNEFMGNYCSLPSKIVFTKPCKSKLDSYSHELLKISSGFVEMGVHAKAGELITNTYLAESAIDFNKGCYPGQETISKIVNNRGAAYYPVVLVGDKEIQSPDVVSSGKKIGSIVQAVEIEGEFFHYALLNRENRIEGKKLDIENIQYLVKNFPLIDSSVYARSEEIFDEAVRLFQTDENERSKELLRYLININPDYADAYESLGVMLGRERKFEEAIEVMKKLADVDKTSVMAQTNLSMYYMQLGDKETAEMHKAEATLKQFEQFGVEANKRDQKEKVLAQEKADKEKRESMFHQVLEIDPEDALANFGLGELEIERENFEKAQDHLQKAILADQKYSVAYLALAKAQLKLKQDQLAKATLTKGIEVASKLGDLMPANEMQSILNKL